MHIRKTRLLTPGPTPLYPPALHAMMGSDIHHRTEDFRRIYRETLASDPPLPRLRDALQDLTDLQVVMGDLPGLRKAIQMIEPVIQANIVPAVPPVAKATEQ